MADARVPLHAVAGPGHPTERQAGGPGGQRGRRARADLGRVHALGSFARRRPRVVVIVGGYASFPAGVAALLTRVPRSLGQHRRRARSRQRSAGPLRRGQRGGLRGTELPRAVVTGTPVRPELGGLDRSVEGRHAGARRARAPTRPSDHDRDGWLARARCGSTVPWRMWRSRGRTTRDRSLYHVTGRRDYGQFAAGPAGARGRGRDEGGALVPGRSVRGPHARALRGGRRVRVPGRRDVGGGAAHPGRAGDPGPAAGSTPATIRRATPKLWSPWAPRCASPTPSATANGCARSSRRCSLTPSGSQAMGEAARRHAHPDAAARIAELVDANAR